MVKAEIIGGVVKTLTKEIVSETVAEMAENLVHFSKARFVLNHLLLPRVVKSMINELSWTVVTDYVYEDLLESIITSEIAELTEGNVKQGQESLEKEEQDKAFDEYVDSLILEGCLAKMSREYEVEETAMLKREELDKQKRDTLAEKKRELRRAQIRAEEAAAAKEKVASTIMKSSKAVVSGAPNTKAINGLHEKGGVIQEAMTNKSKTIVAKSVKGAESRMSIQDAVKERMITMSKQPSGKIEPKNQLENVLMQLHS